MKKVKEGFRYFCKCFEAGNNCTGTFVSEGNQFKVELYSFDDSPDLTDDLPITILLENGLWVQLRGSLSISPGSHGVSSPIVQFFGVTILAHAALIGHSKPPSDLKVTHARFGFKEATSIFRAQLKENNKNSSLILQIPLLEMEFPNHKLKIAKTVLEHAPIAEHQLCFKTTSNVEQSMELVYDYRRFYILTFGAVLNFDYVYLEERNELMSTAQSWHYITKPDRHRLTDDFLNLSTSIFDFSNSKGQDFYKNSLTKWHSNIGRWKDCAAFLGSSFELSGYLSGERLINACACFDNLPIPKTELLTSVEFNCIRTAVETVVKSHLAAENVQQEDNISQRIDAALSNFHFLKMETRPKRIAAIINQVREKFGHSYVAEGIEGLVAKAFTLRGTAAHKVFDPPLHEMAKIDLATLAIEVVCLLFFYTWLDPPSDIFERIKQTRIIFEYRLASISSPS
jgi:hypothetical protein